MVDKYEFIDHTADILFKCEADTLEGLFIQAGLAIGETTTNLSTIKTVIKKEITGKNKNLEYLLFDFLDDLLFYKDSELIIFSKFEIKIKIKKNLKTNEEEYILSCIASGEELQEEKHERKIDIKAITMHLFEVKKKKVDGIEKWTCQVLIDI